MSLPVLFDRDIIEEAKRLYNVNVKFYRDAEDPDRAFNSGGEVWVNLASLDNLKYPIFCHKVVFNQSDHIDDLVEHEICHFLWSQETGVDPLSVTEDEQHDGRFLKIALREFGHLSAYDFTNYDWKAPKSVIEWCLKCQAERKFPLGEKVKGRVEGAVVEGVIHDVEPDTTMVIQSDTKVLGVQFLAFEEIEATFPSFSHSKHGLENTLQQPP